MPRKRFLIDVPSLGAIDREAGGVGQQLAHALRNAIAKKELKAGERLPSTRALASSLGLARGTVMAAFEQLVAEGYLDALVGSGTRVAQALSESAIAIPAMPRQKETARVALPPSAERYATIASALAPLPPVPFSIAVPAGAVALDGHWRRLGNRVRAMQAAAPTSYTEPNGLFTLREAIADYLRKSRAVVCEPENVIITEGTQQGLYVAGRVLLARGDAAWAEDPAYPGLTAVLDEFDIRTQRVPVDEQGFDVARALSICPEARAAFVTPSHQYPLGMPLSMARRLALIAWARENDGWIVEDDYDSELRYAGHPFPAMQGLDSRRVVYLGTFSKVMAPSLRLGYAVVPEPLVDAFAGARALMGRASPTADQHVLAAYMKEGYFEAHIRRIRSIYAERRATLMAEINNTLPWLTIQPSDQGMHLVVWLPTEMDDIEVAASAMSAGLAVRPISPMYAGPVRKAGLMLGFGGFSNEQLRDAVGRLRVILERSKK